MSDVPLVIQLQQLAKNPKGDIEELLNNAYLVASKLKIDDMKAILQFELHGYLSIEDLPSYRVFTGDALIVKSQEYGEIPVNLSNTHWQEYAKKVFCDTPLPLLSSILLDDEKGAYMLQPLMPDVIKELEARVRSANISSSISDLIPHLPDPMIRSQLGRSHQAPPMRNILIKFSSMRLVNIIQSVRRLIFEWSLDLESKGVLGEGLRFTLKEQQAAMSNNNQTFNIANMQGVVGTVSDSSSISQQNTMTVQTANFESLANKLRQHGIDEDDIGALREAINQDPKPDQAGHFGGKVSAWLGSMMTKAATGTIELAVGAAGTVLTDAIKGYYGI